MGGEVLIKNETFLSRMVESKRKPLGTAHPQPHRGAR